MPVCQESCHSFLATKNCLPAVSFVYEGWKRIAKECPKYTEHGIQNCSDYPSSRECQYHIFGKLEFIILLISQFRSKHSHFPLKLFAKQLVTVCRF